MIKELKEKLFLILGIFLIPLVSAQSWNGFGDMRYQIMRLIDGFLDISSPVMEVIIGNYSTSEFFFAKILILIIIFVICKFVLDKTPFGEDNGRVSIILSLIISIIAIRFINENDLINGILIPYGTLGIAITTILPLVIFFYFVHNTKVGPFGRKFFWIIFSIILLVLWISKSNQIGNIANWIYGLTFVTAIFLIIFDKSIHSYLFFSDFSKFNRQQKEESIRILRRRLYEAEQDIRRGVINNKEYEKIKKEITKQMRLLSRE